MGCGDWAAAGVAIRLSEAARAIVFPPVSTLSIVDEDNPGLESRGDGAGRPPSRAMGLLSVAPLALTTVLLLLVTISEGAFQLRYWGPLAIFVLIAVAASGTVRRLRAVELVAAGTLCAFAGWALLSAVWADSPARALEGGARTMLYAGLFAMPLVVLSDRGLARRMAGLLVAGVALIVVVTWARLVAGGEDLFLVGRLDAPVGYRNATAALFTMAFWPLVCLAAVRRTPPLLRALAFGVAILALGLAFLTQSRGVLIAFLAGGLAAVALGPDRVRRSWLGIFAVAALAVMSDDLLVPYDAFVARLPVTSVEIGTAARALGLVAAVGFAAVGLLALLDGGLRMSARSMRLARTVALGALLVLAAGAIGGGIAVTGNPVNTVGDKLREFRSLDVVAPGETTRLGSTGGQRYDLWRIGIDEFKSAPLTGVGEGNYVFGYYEDRRTDRNLSTPHSLPVGTLAELGLVGALLLGGFLVALAVALVLLGRRASPDDRRWAAALAAAATVVLAQTSVDWLWSIPGLTGLAMLCAGMAVALVGAPAVPGAARRVAAWKRLPALVPALGALLVGALFLSDYETRKARVVGERSAAAQLKAARAAERLNPFAVTPHYLQAGALETEGRRDAARRELRAALELEPRSFVTLALLGDLEVRAGDRRAARAFYRRASRLNPLDVGLRELARS